MKVPEGFFSLCAFLSISRQLKGQELTDGMQSPLLSCLTARKKGNAATLCDPSFASSPGQKIHTVGRKSNKHEF